MLTKLLPIFCGALITISISLSSWTMKEVVDLRTQVTMMQSNRFTSGDGLQVWRAIDDVRTDIVRNSERIKELPKEGPPEWFINDMRGIENRLQERISKLENKTDAQQEEKLKKLDRIESELLTKKK